tara:strand:+ start:716 stop:2038 length:1323 start_codon:yes stop_codon:yes gene_type:complete
MVLPLLFSIGLPALAGTGALGATLARLSVPALAGIGAGLGSFVQTGDIGKGIQTGMASFLGGKVLGGLSGSTSTQALEAGTQAAAKPSFIQSLTAPGTPATQVVAGTPSDLATKFLGTETANAAMPFGTGTKGGAFTAAQQGFMPGMIGQTMTDMQMIENRAAKDDADMDTRPPLPNPMIRTLNPNPYAGGFGEANYFSYQRPPRPDGSTPQYPYPYADGGLLEAFLEGGKYLQDNPYVIDYLAKTAAGTGITGLASVPAFFLNERRKRKKKIEDYMKGKADGGILALAEGGEAEADADAMMEEAGINEKDVIMNAILAIKEIIIEEEAEVALAMFVMKYGEEALRNLVDKVQSGEFDETVERFAAGEQGMVEGPGDGSGVDDMVPATLEGEQDVLLSDGEFVLRKKTTDALEKAYGGGFLDIINRAEGDAPKKLEQMVG